MPGIKVHFIDYGNDAYANDLRQLPPDLEGIERASILCALENEVFSNAFDALDVEKQYEFEIVRRSGSLTVVRLYVDGKLFSNDVKNYQNGNTSNGSSFMNETNENGTNAEVVPTNCMMTEAARIKEGHLKSIEQMGMGIFPTKL